MPILKNAKHEAVLQAFIADAERIGWRAYGKIYPNSSQRGAENGFSRLVKNSEFKTRLGELTSAVTAQAVEKTALTLERVIDELALLGFSNMLDFAGVFPDGDLSSLTREQGAAIRTLVIDTYMDGAGDEARKVKRVRFELHDKKGSLSELRRHFEPDKHEIGGKDGKPIETRDVSEPNDIARRVAFLLAQAARAPPAKSAANKPAAK